MRILPGRLVCCWREPLLSQGGALLLYRCNLETQGAHVALSSPLFVVHNTSATAHMGALASALRGLSRRVGGEGQIGQGCGVYQTPRPSLPKHTNLSIYCVPRIIRGLVLSNFTLCESLSLRTTHTLYATHTMQEQSRSGSTSSTLMLP